MLAHTKYSFTLTKQLTDNEREVMGLNFSTDGRCFVKGGEDGFLEMFTVPDFKAYMKIGHPNGRIWSVAFSPDGEYVACSGPDPIVRLYNLNDSQFDQEFSHHSAFANRIAFSPNGLYLSSGGFDGLLNIYSMRSFKLFRSFGDHSDAISDVTVSADSKFLATCSADKTIKLYDLSQHILIHSFQGFDAIANIQFSPDGKYLVSGEVSGKVNLYQLSNKALIHKFDTPNAVTTCFSPTGDLLMIAYGDGSIGAYNLEDKKLVVKMADHTARICSICFSPDGNLFTSCGYDKTINIYEVTEGDAVSKPVEVIKNAAKNIPGAEWFNTPERRLSWWNELEEQWKKVFGQYLFYKYKTYASLTDHHLKTIFNLKELYLKYNSEKGSRYSNIGFSLTNLSGIQSLTKLEKLDFQGNEICDLSPLQNLINLRELDCSNNRIVNLWPLSALQRLEKLNCSKNSISDLSPLNGSLKNFYSLTCSGNALSSVIEAKYTIRAERPAKVINEPLLVEIGSFIGDIHLGDKVPAVLQKLGNEYTVKKSDKYTNVDYVFPKLGITIMEYSDIDWGIREISVYPPARARTNAGISLIENTLADVIALYGEPVDFSIMDGENVSEDIWHAWIGDLAFCVERDMRLPKFPSIEKAF
jgi:WD40 repeat protein